MQNNFLRLSFLVFALFLLQTAGAQFHSRPGMITGPVKHSLILYNPDELRSRLISVDDTIWYKTGPESSSFGCEKITRIVADTVFFKEGFVRTSSITAIKAKKHDEPVEYDLTKWVIVAPPPEAFSSAATLNAFKRWLEENIKSDGSYSVNDWRASDRYLNSRNQSTFSHRSLPGILYFQDTAKLTYCRVSVFRFLRFTTNYDSLVHPGMVSWIDRDTIFLKNQRFLVKDMKEITLSKFASPSFPVYRSRIYQSPEGLSSFERNQYIHSMENKLKDDHSKIHSDTIHSNFLKINVTRLPLLVLALAYETKIDKHTSFEVEISGQFKVIYDTTARDLIPYVFPFYRYSGFSIIPGIKFYTNASRYIEPIFVYRYLTMSWSNSVFPPWSDDPVQSQTRNDYGLGVRIGKMKNFNGLIFDWYVGFGLQYITVHQLAYGVVDSGKSKISWFHSDHHPDVRDIQFPYPLLNLGIKLGFGW